MAVRSAQRAPGTRPVGRPRRESAATRDRILKVALAEFAARGYDATGVERLARKSRVNKALIYYYFGSKLALYQALVAREIRRLIDRLRAVGDAEAPATVKLDRYVAGLVAHLDERRELAPLMLRELADGGRRLDVDTLRLLVGILPIVQAIMTQGRDEGAFRAADPLLTHFVLMGAAMFFTSNQPIRRRILQLGLAQPPLATEPFVAHLQAVARGTLCKDQNDAAKRP